MADWYGYFYVEALSLTAQQKATLVNALKALGERNQDEHPNERNHWRIRQDNNAVIFEADSMMPYLQSHLSKQG